MRTSNRRNAKAFAVLSAAVGLTALTHTASAQTWISTTSSNWANGANWTGGAPIPGVTTQIGFAAAGTYTATNDIANPFTLNALSFNNGSGNPTIAGGGLLF